MPIPPCPMTFHCDQCNWGKAVAPVSDALGPGDWHHSCPKCGNPNLQVSRAGALASLLAKAARHLNIRKH